jgi:NAD(P)-dependent dehydrogenase (short-subunit alcohol dehydrogenase family)
MWQYGTMVDGDPLGYRGKTTVVTGASSGMGGAAVLLLGELGAKVHAVDLLKPAISGVAFYETDLSDPAQVAVTAAAIREVGPIDFLFNCAGVPHTLGALQCMLVNYVGARHLTEALLPSLVDGAGIANIASTAGMGWQGNLRNIFQLLAAWGPAEARRWCEEHPEIVKDGYSLSKEALIVWTMQQAYVLGKERGIRMNCIAPCPTSTAFMVPTVEDIGKDFFDRYPYPTLGRMATPEEQAWPLVMLNSSRMNVVSGAILYTDQAFSGGLYTGMIDPASLVPKGYEPT